MELYQEIPDEEIWQDGEIKTDKAMLEQIFNREKSSMVKDRANNMKKSIQNLKMCWNRLYADTQER